MNHPQILLSQREAAKYLNIDKDTLAKYRKLKYFTTIQLKKTILFSKEDLDTFKKKLSSGEIKTPKSKTRKF